MYFKLNAPTKDKYTDMGMVCVSASFYLDETDEGYDKYMAEHYVQVPVIPEGGYPGKMTTEEGMPKPVDQKDYDDWFASLERVWQLNPFCNHSIQFEATVTKEEILWCFEFALAQTHKNYLEDDLHCQKGIAKVVNQNINYISRKAFYQGVKQIPVASQSAYEKAELAKVIAAETKVTELKSVDFTKVKTIVKYKVKK
jgi:hypothetical protein